MKRDCDSSENLKKEKRQKDNKILRLDCDIIEI
jgi:hypothetical protein